MSLHEEFERADAFTTAAFGRPGSRLFVLQVRSDGRSITMKVEKQQVAALAEYLRRLLDDAPETSERPLAAAMSVTDGDDIAFVAGSIGVAYDPRRDLVFVQIDEMTDDVDDDEVPLDVERSADGSRVRLHLSRGQAAAFCEHADDVVAAGRPSCLFCGRPMDPEGHPCPRMN